MSQYYTCVLKRGFAAAVALSIVVGCGVTWAAAGSQPSRGSLPKMMDRDIEVALPLSACPVSLAEGAAVYVLRENGYIKARDSKNGFTALVTRL